MSIVEKDAGGFDIEAPLVIVGAGACGLVAALEAAGRGVEAVVLERDPSPCGSTSLSSGMIPACGTKAQNTAGVADSVDIMAGDILAKARGETDPAMVEAVCRESGSAVDWLTDEHGVELTLVEGFLYPGHRRARMHAPPSRTGADLMSALLAAGERAGLSLVTEARADRLYADADGSISGVGIVRPDGAAERIGCRALVLACNGFGGNRDLVARFIPDMVEADYFGHAGNRGDALLWGEALGAATADLGAFQGHGSVASPHGILITWALMMEGGIQVNALGERFSCEHDGYSEQVRRVVAQPGHVAWAVFDERLRDLGRGFEDFRNAEAAGALRSGDTPAALAEACGLPAHGLERTVSQCAQYARGEAADPFGRDFTASPPLVPPYFAVRVTGALFHTQGGLVVDREARVLDGNGKAFSNLFAGGGAARGVSGPADWGYLSGNGLLTAVTLGRIAGRTAARQVG